MFMLWLFPCYFNVSSKQLIAAVIASRDQHVFQFTDRIDERQDG
jgi:hypothetical protein